MAMSYSWAPTVSGNSTAGERARGGGVSARGNVTLTGSTVSGNSTAGIGARGGGLRALGNITLTSSTVSGNSTALDFANGGGVFARGNVTLTGSTVSGNSTAGSDAEGGGVYAYGNVTLSQSTVTNNRATDAGSTGGGIWNENGAILIDGSIVAGNTAGGGMNDIDPGSGSFTVNFSLLGTGISPGAGSGNLFDDNPMLGVLANNGGPTQTHQLLSGSPAIDAGDPDIDFDAGEFDQRGAPFVRVADGGVNGLQIDMGAVEGVFLLGDSSQNGFVNFGDIGPFITLLAGGTYLNAADTNRDGFVNFGDIGPFILILAAGSPQASMSQSVFVAPPVSAPVSIATTSMTAPVAFVESTVEVPVTTATSPIKTAVSKPAASSKNVPLVKQLPQTSRESVRKSSALFAAMTSELPASETTVVATTSVETYTGPAFFAPTVNTFLVDRSVNSSGAVSNESFATQFALKGNTEPHEVSVESSDERPSANLAIDKSFSTASQLSNARPELLDEIFAAPLKEGFKKLI